MSLFSSARPLFLITMLFEGLKHYDFKIEGTNNGPFYMYIETCIYIRINGLFQTVPFVYGNYDFTSNPRPMMDKREGYRFTLKNHDCHFNRQINGLYVTESLLKFQVQTKRISDKFAFLCIVANSRSHDLLVSLQTVCKVF